MKKIVALILALLMASGCSAVAFADEITPVSDTGSTEVLSEETTPAVTDETTTQKPVDKMSMQELVDLIVNAVGTGSGNSSPVEDEAIRVMDLIENIGTSLAPEGDVRGAVDDLDEKIGTLGLTGDLLEYVEGLITSLKTKIKEFYANERATETVEATSAYVPAQTGNNSGAVVAAFAVFTAAAAAFVCVKKKKD